LKKCADADAASLKADAKFVRTTKCTADDDSLAEVAFTAEGLAAEACFSLGNDVPFDMPPAAKGSFKGYTNRWTYANVGGIDKYFDDRAEFTGQYAKGQEVKYPGNESANKNGWTGSAGMAAIIGFAVFGLGIIFAVIMLVIDMRKRLAMYEEMIADDISVMQKLGMGSRQAEFDRELAERLAGSKGDLGTDDQLITQALELKAEEFAKYM
jgi:hypothetical protein